MAKKKKKTLASTKKSPTKVVASDKPKKITKKGLRGLFSKAKKEEKEMQKLMEKEEKKAKELLKKEQLAQKDAEKAEKIKEAAKESAKESTQKSKVEKKPRKPRKSRKPISAAKKQKMRGGLLILIGAFAVIFIGYFLFGKIFSPQDLAEISPAEKTVGVFELNVDGGSGQVQQFYEVMDKYAVYKKENIIKLLETVLPVDYDKDLYPWIGRKIGFILYDSSSFQGMQTLTPIIFVESRDHNGTLEFLKGRTLAGANETFTGKDYNGQQIYRFSVGHKASFTFINNYLVVIENEKIMKSYLDNLSDQPRLSDDPDYRKVANNLPRGSLIFAYVNLQKVLDIYEKDEAFISQKGQELLAFRPFLEIFRAEGLTVFAESDHFTAQTFTSIDLEALDGENYITFNEKYQGELLSYANEDPIFLGGGHDLNKEINRIEDVFKSGTKTPALVFEGLLEAQKQTYFGKDIDLKKDILPLFTGEYLITIENSLEDPQVSIFIELNNKTTEIPQFEKVVNAFVEVSGLFTPKVQEVVLPDGTVGQEIVASPEIIEKTTGNYEGNTITTLKLGDTGISIHYTILDEIVVLSTSIDSLKKIVDRYEGNLQSGFSTGSFYSKNIKPVLRTADEVMHLKVGALTELLGLSDDPNLAPYLVPFTNLTITKNYFRDGISTIYLIEVI